MSGKQIEPVRHLHARFDHLELDETGHFAREDRLRSVGPVTLPSPADINAPVRNLRAHFDHLELDGTGQFAREDWLRMIRRIT